MKKMFTLLFCISLVFSLNGQVLLQEDFEDGSVPDDWSQQTMASDGGWTVGTAAEIQSQFWPVGDNGTLFAATNDDACNCDKSADYLITPPLDFTGMSNVVLSYDLVFAGGEYAGAMESAAIEASLDGGTTWGVIANIEGDGTVDWRSTSIDISALAGSDNVLLAFRYNDGGGWTFGFAIDNVLIFSPRPWDAALVDLDVSLYHEVNSDVAITGTLNNLGANTINSFTVTWSDGVNEASDTITGLNIEPLSSYEFTHSVPYTVADLTDYDIEVTISNLNGNMDEDDTNNGQTTTISAVSFIPDKKVVAEEATGTWCVWCPRGAVYMDSMYHLYPQTYIPIAVHGPNLSADPMTNPAYMNGFNNYISGFPSISLDRLAIDVLPNNLAGFPIFEAIFLGLRDGRVYPATSNVSAEYDDATRDLSVTIETEFVAPLAGDLRFNVVLTEDGVTGTGSGYAQTNAYAGGANGPMAGWENMPDPVPASQMVYDHVVRRGLSGFAGDAGSIPDTVYRGDVISQTYEFTIPASWDEEKINIIGMVLDGESGAIMNSTAIKLMTTGTKDVEFDHAAFEVFPNPVSDIAWLRVNTAEASDINVQVMNSVGQVVVTRDFGQILGDMMLNVPVYNLENGIYYVHMRINDKLATKKIVVNR